MALAIQNLLEASNGAAPAPSPINTSACWLSGRTRAAGVDCTMAYSTAPGSLADRRCADRLRRAAASSFTIILSGGFGQCWRRKWPLDRFPGSVSPGAGSFGQFLSLASASA